ncbi:fused DNA-binding response regulator in two-component regulatory system with GlnL: response regulator; sigma54 interaction protein [Burkholderiales bacterium]|jgi:two-component system, NtrC family, nitrogen regulation response regulator GlnG|nr:fused DNA-binding response regulator in two-component regulatory system with GlnL: response regulator; sigma54 interaction protein [Burkholderiales bacterium]
MTTAQIEGADKAQVWVVDDDRSIRWVLEKALSRANLPSRVFATAGEVLDALKVAKPQVLVSDIRMPGMGGIELLQEVKRSLPSLPVIIMTAYSDLESAVSAFQGGAFEYLPKPFDIEKAIELIRRALDESLQVVGVEEDPLEVPEILGQAPAMHDVFRAIGRLSQSHATVLITGESGSGKEVVARALHRHSARAARPFIALNTAAIPRDLLESELFGHERGAFTGAQAMRRGRFEQAEGGTLFLDEIGDMPAELQTRLLRVLSDGFFYRVGGHQPLKADARVIAATHQNLDEQVREGRFREDLFHRLNVIRLRLPPLRERREDIPLLARHFLARSAKELGVESKRLTEEALQFVSQLQFPGNVRQLENLCHWLTVLAPAQWVRVEDFPLELRQERGLVAGPLPAESAPVAEIHRAAAASASAPAGSDWRATLRLEVKRLLESGESGIIDELTSDFESVVIGSALSHVRGRRIEAAARLGLGRNTITRKIRELKLDHSDD